MCGVLAVARAAPAAQAQKRCEPSKGRRVTAFCTGALGQIRSRCGGFVFGRAAVRRPVPSRSILVRPSMMQGRRILTVSSIRILCGNIVVKIPLFFKGVIG